MIYSQYMKQGLRNGVLTALYIGLVVTFMQNASRMLGVQDTPYLSGFAAITLFVVSALITGSLVLWQPVQLLLDGKRQDAGTLLFITGASLVVILVLALVGLLVVR